MSLKGTTIPPNAWQGTVLAIKAMRKDQLLAEQQVENTRQELAILRLCGKHPFLCTMCARIYAAHLSLPISDSVILLFTGCTCARRS